MIATEGTDFYDKNHTEKAADYIANIIAAKELGAPAQVGGARRTHYLGQCVVERLK